MYVFSLQVSTIFAVNSITSTWRAKKSLAKFQLIGKVFASFVYVLLVFKLLYAVFVICDLL